MAFRPYIIKYPISFWTAIIVAIVTSLVAVAWHGILFFIAVLNTAAVLALPTISRYEMRYVERQNIEADASSTEH
jgi:uncharacterized protein (DUF58 family)